MKPAWIARAIIAILALPSAARAGDHARLQVARERGTAECPDESALSAAVGARLGYEPFSLDAPSLIVVRFRRAGERLVASVQERDASGKVVGERKLSSAGSDCEELASTTALTISILLDPRSASVAPGPPATEVKPDPPPEPEPAPATPQAPVAAAPSAVAASASAGPPRPVGARAVEAAAPAPTAGGAALIPLSLGPLQAFSAGGHAFGVRVGVGAQFDLGPRWALRLPLLLAVGSGDSQVEYGELDLAPSVVYRFGSAPGQRFTPYVGAGIKVGAFGAGRALLGKPLVAPVGAAVGIEDLFDEHRYLDDPNFETTATIGGQGLLGGSWRASRLLSLDFELTGELVPIGGTLVAAIGETFALRLTL